MRKLPLFEELPRLALQDSPTLQLNPTCRRCHFHSNAKSVCIPADGETGGLLVVGQAPGLNEDRHGRPFVGQSGSLLRDQIKRLWTGPVCFDNAVRCFPGRTEGGDERPPLKEIAACRPYLAQTLAEVRPTRVIVLGSIAIKSVIGSAFAPLSVRRGYCWMEIDGDYVPVLMLMHPAAALRNRFLRKWFEDDLRWALTFDPPFAPQTGATVALVEDEHDARQAVDHIRATSTWGAVDVETGGIPFNRDFNMLACSVTPDGSATTYTWTFDALRRPAVTAPLVELLTDSSWGKSGANFKFDVIAIKLALGCWVRGPVKDVQLVRKMMESDALVELETLATLVGMGGLKDESIDMMESFVSRVQRDGAAARRGQLQLGISNTFESDSAAAHFPALAEKILAGHTEKAYRFSLLPKPVLARRNARDSHATMLIAQLLDQRLKSEPGISFVNEQLMSRAVYPFARMESAGIAVDRDTLVSLQQHYQRDLDAAHAKLMSWGEFDPRKPKDLRDQLFVKLKLRSREKTKSGMESTDKDVLKLMESEHPIIGALLNWRSIAKNKETYADGLLAAVRDDGCIHTTINLDGARSGRLSSEDPNLQNIPIRTKEGKLLRRAFVAPPGYLFVESDFSQMEIRVAAALSGDPIMRQLLLEGSDYHRRTAELICEQAFGIKVSLLEDYHRDIAKTLNFAVLYGQSDQQIAIALSRKADPAKGIAERIVTPDEAGAIRRALFGRFTVLGRWISEQKQFALRNGYHRTWWAGREARRRWLLALGQQGRDPEDPQKYGKAQRASFNGPVQGTANEYTLASIIELDGVIDQEGLDAQIVLTVHDSIYSRVRESQLDEYVWHTHRIMTGWPMNGIPIKADFKIGPNLYDMQKIKLAG